METNRFVSEGNFTIFDWADTYALPFQMSFVLGNASGSMCSYISLSFDGGPMVPACANDFLLNQLVRGAWGRPDAVHTSDCGAVAYMRNKNFTKNDTYSAAAALNGGLDLNSNTILPSQLELAIALGLTNTTVLDRSVTRTLAWRFRLGQLDPLEAQPAYMAFSAADIGSAAHVAAAAEGSAQGLVLVKRGALPLAPGRSLAVLGPLGVADEALLGDYYADAVCPGATGYANTAGFGCVETIAAAVARRNAGGATTAVTGVSVKGNDTSWGAALAAAAAADVVVLVVGSDRTVAGEGTDLRDTGLPGVQSAFALAVAAAAAGKPLVLVLVSSFPLAFDELVAAFPAVVLAYTPGMRGGDAVAAALFGANRWGRAVLTHYPRAYASRVALTDFGIVPTAVNPGRTYRYYDGSAGAATVVFGEGLSYNALALACAGGAAGATVEVACNVTSTAGPDGDQVLHVYHRVGADVVARVGGAHAIPLRSLVAAQRLALPAGTTRVAAFRVAAADALFLTDARGGRTVYAGTHFLDVWDGGANNVTITITVGATAAGDGLLGRMRA
jgi:beta-D-xylosidase 4